MAESEEAYGQAEVDAAFEALDQNRVQFDEEASEIHIRDDEVVVGLARVSGEMPIVPRYTLDETAFSITATANGSVYVAADREELLEE
jgi:hypothetical protein